MKNLWSKILLSLIVAIGLNGCYTIVWVPGTEFPTEDNSNTTTFYDNTYYGDYYFFYDSPWWWDYTPPVSSGYTSGSRDGNPNIENPRNSGDRGTPNRVPDVQPPSRNADHSGNNGKDNSSNSGSTSSDTNVRSSSSSGSGNTSSGSSGSGNNARNNDGGRNSGGRR
jgi:hypothetical protein